MVPHFRTVVVLALVTLLVSAAFVLPATPSLVLPALAQLAPAGGVDSAADQPDQAPAVIPGLAVHHSGDTYINLPVTFTVTVPSPERYTYSWSFDDGATADGRVVTHAFATAQVHFAEVLVTDGQNSEIVRTSVKINPIPIDPTPTPVRPSGLTVRYNPPVEANNPVAFFTTLATGSNVLYTWYFGDGEVITDGSKVRHIYTTPRPDPNNPYIVTVVAENNLGKATASVAVTILDERISGLDFTVSDQAVVGGPVFFSARVRRGTNVRYEWQFGDGTSGFGQAVEHTYPYSGTFQVALRASNVLPSEQNTSKPVVVRPKPPQELKVFNDSPKLPGQPVHFDASVKSNAEITYVFDWGDGNVNRFGGIPANQGLFSVPRDKVYTEAGRYAVHVTAFNEGGSTATAVKVYVGKSETGEQMGLTWQPPAVYVGHPIVFTAAFAPGDTNANAQAANYLYVWDFGDRTDEYTTTVPTIEHTFVKHGNWVVYVKAQHLQNEDFDRETDAILLMGSRAYLPTVGLRATPPPLTQEDFPIVPVPPTATPVPVPTDTPTATVIPTETPTPTAPATATTIPTDTPLPTATNTETPIPLPTDTETPMPTETPTTGPGGTIPIP